MRIDTCLTCNELYRVRPNHPAWEKAHCPSCYRLLSPLWRMHYVTPAAVGRAIRAEDV